MVSTTFTKETHLKIDLPEASLEPVESVVTDIIDVVVQANGDYVVNGKALVNQQEKTLFRALEISADGNMDKPITITGDAQTSYQAVITVMDVVGQLGFSQLRMTTRQPVEK